MECKECKKKIEILRKTRVFCGSTCRKRANRKKISVTKNNLSVTVSVTNKAVSVTKDSKPPLSVTIEEDHDGMKLNPYTGKYAYID